MSRQNERMEPAVVGSHLPRTADFSRLIFQVRFHDLRNGMVMFSDPSLLNKMQVARHCLLLH